MSKFLFLPLMLLVSCSAPKETPSSIGVIQRFEPAMVTYEDGEKIKSICNALSSKEEILEVLASSNTEYQFSYSQKNCSDATAPAMKTIPTIIQKSENNNYFFKSKSADSFGFSEVETTTSGVLSAICKDTGYLMSPMQTSKTGAMWFSTITPADVCVSDANHLCVHIQRGTVVDNLDYEIHTNEVIRFRITNPRRGFFVDRILVSSAGCSDKKTIEKRASLR